MMLSRLSLIMGAASLITMVGSIGMAQEESLETLPSDASPAQWKVKKGGYFKNRVLTKQLDLIFSEQKPLFSAADIEDAALILVSYLESEGYLAARTIAHIELADGTRESVEWDDAFDVYLPRETAAKSVVFELKKGPRFYYESLEVVGNQVLSSEEVEAFFYSEPFLFQNEKARLFTHSQLQSSKGNLQAHLNSLGYQEAQVRAEILEMDKQTGACSVRVALAEGPKYLVRNIGIKLVGEAPKLDLDVSRYKDQPYSRFVTQDISRDLRNFYYRKGYPDTTIESSTKIESKSKQQKNVDLSLSVTPGDKVFVASVDFTGSERTRPSLIQSRLLFEEGDPLNPSLLEGSRLNLSRLGLFDHVSYDTEPVDANHRQIVFDFTERTTWSVDTILGWGSYEQLRGGLIVEKLNLLGMGHRARVKTILSVKSQLGEMRYLAPEVFGTPASLSAKVFRLKREEVAFEREDFGLNLGISRNFDRLGLDVDTVYSIRNLELQDSALGDDLASQGESTVGSVELRFGRDHRDNALNPKDGYRFFSRNEWAEEALGGEVDFQRAEFGISYHNEISRGLYWHGGFTHGAVGSFSEAQSQVPASVLFYPGGENSIRGYQLSEASPRDAEGKFIGSRAYTLINLELEQSLSKSLSAVLFLDVLGTASRIEKYPYDETLSSVGLGVRFKTFMGPVRLEYGHNLDPREFDPEGTFHFALGYPF